MGGCCSAESYQRVFSPRMARWAAARYLRRGMGWGPRRTLELFQTGAIGGGSFLEIGGGIGDLQVDLLKAVVDRAVSIELSPSYEDKAAELLRGLEGLFFLIWFAAMGIRMVRSVQEAGHEP